MGGVRGAVDGRADKVRGVRPGASIRARRGERAHLSRSPPALPCARARRPTVFLTQSWVRRPARAVAPGSRFESLVDGAKR